MVSYCDHCFFKKVHFCGMIPEVNVHVGILSVPTEKHVCDFLTKVQNVQLVDKNLDLPNITFSKFDHVMKWRFYEISYPIIRRKLWFSSKKTSNLGKKPTTYLATNIDFNLNFICDSKMDISPAENIVIEIRDFATFTEITFGDLTYLSRFVEFNNHTITVKNSKLSLKDLRYVCNPNIVYVTFSNTNFHFTTLIIFLREYPNLRYLRYYDPLDDGWEYTLLHLKSQLAVLSVSPEKITKFEILANLCKSGTCINIHYTIPTYNVNKLVKFFKIDVEKNVALHKLIINDSNFVVKF